MKVPLNAELSLAIGMGRCLRRLLNEIEAAQGGDLSPAFRKAHRRHKQGIIAVIRRAYDESGIGAVNDAESAAFIRALEYGEILEGEFFMVSSELAHELAPTEGNFGNVTRRSVDEPPPTKSNVAVDPGETKSPQGGEVSAASRCPARKKATSTRCRPFPAARPLSGQQVVRSEKQKSSASASASAKCQSGSDSDKKSKEVMSQWR